MTAESLEIRPALGAEFDQVTMLMRQYIVWLPFDVGAFQDVDRELEQAASEYGPPDGVALLAWLGAAPVGVVGVRRFSPEIAELKRMWVGLEGRGLGIGRLLATGALAEARRIGYRAIRLDTVVGVMDGANHLYESLGFREIPPYRTNPIPGARFMELDLAS